jgi:hypothetical protein
VELQIEQTEAQIDQAVASGNRSREQTQRERLAHLRDILRYQRELSASLRTAVEDWLADEDRLGMAAAEAARAVASQVNSGFPTPDNHPVHERLRRAQQRLADHRALRETPGWVERLAHQANRRQREREEAQNRRRTRSRTRASRLHPASSGDDDEEQDPDWAPTEAEDDDDDEDGAGADVGEQSH